MTITTALATSFKQGLFIGTYNVTSDAFKLALYDSNAVLNASTTTYTSLHECVGTGYTAGGITLTGGSVFTNGTTVGMTFDNPTFTAITLSDVRGYMIYDTTHGNACVSVFDFGQSFSFTIQNALITFPTPGLQSGVAFIL